ncbi:MAG: NAD(P)H-dependent oxidoreductase subunit E [Candidatus Cloacimonetes bacterium]|nr:NAD(P)H-dependent oxidoreductase subunit E [Candidatus Cloacimonadota bacterium]
MFTFETVSCLGACGLAPVLVVDDEIYGQVKPEQALAILDKIEAEERENA